MQVNFLPFICESFSTNTKIYKYIDKLYQKNKNMFYKTAKKSKWYSHPMAKEGALEQEEYFKKMLGILLYIEKYQYEVIEICIKGWPYTYTYIENHTVIKLEEFLYKFIKKNKSIENIQNDELNSNINILLFLAYEKIDKTSNMYINYINSLSFRLEHYKQNSPNRINLNNVDKEQKQHIKELKKSIYENYGNLKDFNIIVKEKELNNYLNMVDCLFDYENISLVSICNNIKFTEKDINEILYLWILGQDKNDVPGAAKFLVDMIRLKYFAKAYKEAKEYHFQNNKETMFIELDEINKKLDKSKAEMNKKDNDIQEIKFELEKLEKENLRLKKQLKNKSQNENELNSLREFIFNLNNEKTDIDIKEDIDIEKLNNIKAVIIGGTNKWQQRMKGILPPSFIFISNDSLNFDKSILDNIDYVFIYCNYLSHAMYYKVIENIENKKIKYINHSNDNLVVKEILSLVY